jgi:hypothetical protein
VCRSNCFCLDAVSFGQINYAREAHAPCDALAVESSLLIKGGSPNVGKSALKSDAEKESGSGSYVAVTLWNLKAAYKAPLSYMRVDGVVATVFVMFEVCGA